MRHIMRPLVAGLLLAMGLTFLAASAGAEHNTTGPVPPPGTDRGLRPWTRSQVVLPDVPAYYWHHGCGPTAVGMVIGYYDGQGFPDLVPGSAATQTPEVDAMIATDGGQPDCDLPDGDHFQDYACPIDWYPPVLPDRSQTGGAHTGNCVADFMRTSWSSQYNLYGWSQDPYVPISFRRYVRYASAYEPESVLMWSSYFTWEDYKAEIDAGRPMVLLVDTDGDNSTDHFVTAVGYDDATHEYAIHDTWDLEVHWYVWHIMAYGDPWGVFSITTCSVSYPAAACCVGASCEVLTEEDCLTLGGIWKSEAPECTPDPCAQGIAGRADEGLPAWIAATPNPLNGETLIRLSTGPRGGSKAPARLAIYDLAGRCVRLLADPPSAPGVFETRWDGRDDEGRPVISGVYVLRLTGGPRSASQRITVVH
ncbi:MAG: C39 family peptidase [Candidatus Eisenbacteria bacterium]